MSSDIAPGGMKLLHCTWSGEIGGMSRALYQLVRAQRHEGWGALGVLFGSDGGHYQELAAGLGCRVSSARARSGRDLQALPSMIRVFRQYDIHHFHAPEPLMFAASLLSGRKVRVFTERAGSTYRTYRFKKKLRNAVVGLLLRHFFHAFSGNTRHASRMGAERYRLRSRNFRVTYNGIDYSLLEPTRSRESVRRELEAGPPTVVVGTTAELRAWKRIDLLLDACAGLSDLDLKVVIVGDGPDRRRLERLRAERGLGERVLFTGMRKDVADYVAAFDVFVLSSNACESFGNSVVEAMALGLPSIVFADSPGPCEHLVAGETGFVVQDVAELGQVLRRLTADPELRVAIGSRARRQIHERYSLTRMAVSYLELYAAAVRARTGGAGARSQALRAIEGRHRSCAE